MALALKKKKFTDEVNEDEEGEDHIHLLRLNFGKQIMVMGQIYMSFLHNVLLIVDSELQSYEATFNSIRLCAKTRAILLLM